MESNICNSERAEGVEPGREGAESIVDSVDVVCSGGSVIGEVSLAGSCGFLFFELYSGLARFSSVFSPDSC
jgi:hypothetical protein